jgi:CubicO group peptidase (beta-lactamase class C family)
VAGAALTAAVVIGFYAYQFVIVGTAYSAHMLCSALFVSGRTAESVRSTDLAADDLAPLRYVTTDVDADARRVRAHFYGMASRTAIHRDRLGCVVADDVPRSDAVTSALPTQRAFVRELAHGSNTAVDGALDWAFAEPDPTRMRRTRAVVVVHDGRVIAERYADGFDADTPQLGWSMAKGVVNALVGVLVKEGRLALDAPIGEQIWPAGDPRRSITLSQMLRMSSGLDFDEDSINPRGGVLYMLLRALDVPTYAATTPLRATPGTYWRYSSATTNLIMAAIRRRVGEEEYSTLPRRLLFDRLDMRSAVMETDAHGNYIGSSFVYATARDWARFGLLYLTDGVWNGERVLPDGWVDYSRTPAPAAPDRQYGAHFWLKVAPNYEQPSAQFDFPPDTFHAIGHEGQFVTIIPSRRVVIVRLGLTRHAGAWDHREFVRRVLSAI